MLKGIIFDFDGVIVESVQVKSDAFAELYSPYGPDIVKKVVEHHEENGGMSRFDKIRFYHEIYLNKNITEKEVLNLANQFSSLVVDKVIAAPYVTGVLEYMKKYYKQYKLFISTGTPTKEINQILKARKIDQYFTDVFGSPDRKITHINNIKSKYGMSSEDLIFYGDSSSDLDAAKNEDIPFILIQNRFNKKLAESFKGKIINNFMG